MIKFKSELIKERFNLVHPKLKEIAEDLAHFCDEAGEELVITDAMSTFEEDKKLKRQSDTHRTGRAVDIRNKEWDAIFRAEFIYYANSRYKQYGAEVNGEKVLIRDKASHIHLQLNRAFTMPELIEED